VEAHEYRLEFERQVSTFISRSGTKVEGSGSSARVAR
jgi:hypothetical protein